MKKDIVIFGSGGLAAGDLTWLIEDINQEESTWNLLGFLDEDSSQIGHIKKTYEVLGDSSWLNKHSNIYCAVGIGAGYARERIRNDINDRVAGFPTLIHPSVLRSNHIEIGEGCLILPGTTISGGTQIGNQVILNPGCRIGHDVVLKDFTMVAPGANLSGWVEIGKYSDIGTGASIRQLIKIGENVRVGAGAAVVKDVPDNCTVAGVPAKVIKKDE